MSSTLSQRDIINEIEFRRIELQNSRDSGDDGKADAADCLYKFLLDKGILRPPNKNIKCIELGCGWGAFTFKLAKLGYNIIGIDISSEQIEYNNQKCNQYQLPSIFRVFDINNFSSLDGNSYDYVFAIQVLHHFKKIDWLFRDIFRVLKSKGKVIIIEANTANIIRLFSAILIWIDCAILGRRLRLAQHPNEGFYLIRTYKKNIFKYGDFESFPYLPENYKTIKQKPKYYLFSKLASFLSIPGRYYAIDICLVGEKK